MINVSVSNVAGDSIDLELRSDVTASAVKDQIGTQWSVPQKYQQLVHDTDVLQDADSLALRCAVGGTAVRLTMVVSVDAVARELKGASFQRQLSVLKNLATVGRQGVGMAVAFICGFLVDDTARLAAAHALGFIAKGDSQAVELVGRLFDHDDELVREAAAEALSQVAAPGDAAAIAMLTGHAGEDESPKVRRAILEALSKIAERGDAVAVATAYTGLADGASDVRWAAARALASLAAGGDAEAVKQLIALFDDDMWLVRHAAAEALADVAATDDPVSTAALARHFDSEDDYQVKKAIHQTLAKIAGQEPPSQTPQWSGGVFAPFAHNLGGWNTALTGSEPDWD